MKKEVWKKHRVRFNNNILYLIIAVIVILMLILGQRMVKDVEEEVEEIVEGVGSGFLEIETFPSDAEIFVDGVYKGISPTTLYNIPVGAHNVVIRKAGYEDLVEEVSVDAGKKTYLEERLVVKVEEEIIDIIEEEIIETIEEDIEVIEPVEEIPTNLGENVISVGSETSFYYDFSEKEFGVIRKLDPDIVSRRFDTYFLFTRIHPVNIKVIDKSIDEIKKEDCSGIAGSLDYLHSGRSLCIITKENNIVAVGGYWQNTENAELVYKLLS